MSSCIFFKEDFANSHVMWTVLLTRVYINMVWRVVFLRIAFNIADTNTAQYFQSFPFILIIWPEGTHRYLSVFIYYKCCPKRGNLCCVSFSILNVQFCEQSGLTTKNGDKNQLPINFKKIEVLWKKILQYSYCHVKNIFFCGYLGLIVSTSVIFQQRFNRCLLPFWIFDIWLVSD